jgi:uncharacterized protein YjbK
MNICLEFERKFMLSCEEYKHCFELLSHQITPTTVWQINYYYDDSIFSLFERNETLRVRQIGDKLTLEYKHSKKHIGNIRRSEESSTQIIVLPKIIIIGSIETTMSGFLITERNDFLLKDTKISLDRSIYLGMVDYELEVETNGLDELPQCLTTLTYIERNAAKGKYRRFVSRLKSIDTTYEIC